jgi:hypothetical protein
MIRLAFRFVNKQRLEHGEKGGCFVVALFPFLAGRPIRVQAITGLSLPLTRALGILA